MRRREPPQDFSSRKAIILNREPKIFYYTDPLRDDFAEMGIQKRTVDDTFSFVHNGKVWRLVSGALYYGLGAPFGLLISKIWFDVRIRNRQALKGLKDGYFLYGNHTQAFTDAVCPGLMSLPRRTYVVAGAESVSIKGIAWLVQMLGGLILPTKPSGMRSFLQAVEQRCREKSAIMIYPEAHLWPYYTGVRPFADASFAYPVKFGKPVVGVVTTYRKRALSFLPPAITITVSDPFYRDEALDDRAARRKLRDQVYAFMCAHTDENEVEYVRYLPKGPKA